MSSPNAGPAVQLTAFNALRLIQKACSSLTVAGDNDSLIFTFNQQLSPEQATAFTRAITEAYKNRCKDTHFGNASLPHNSENDSELYKLTQAYYERTPPSKSEPAFKPDEKTTIPFTIKICVFEKSLKTEQHGIPKELDPNKGAEGILQAIQDDIRIKLNSPLCPAIIRHTPKKHGMIDMAEPN